MDEHRLGLKPILRRVWALRGQRPQVVVRPRYEWLYLYGFVHPRSGRTWWLTMPTVSIVAFNLALTEFAADLQLSTRNRILLLLDRAGWHISPEVVRPPGLDLQFLPPYTPELQPAERLWTLTNEGIANRCFDSVDELEAAQTARCLAISEQREAVAARTNYWWWPDDRML